jgi:hypothetical protein
MRWLLPLLLASLLTLGLSSSSLGRGAGAPLHGSFGTHRVTGEPRNGRAAPVFCARPATLRLRRFEDRSAQLLCGGRVLLRVSVPG